MYRASIPSLSLSLTLALTLAPLAGGACASTVPTPADRAAAEEASPERSQSEVISKAPSGNLDRAASQTEPVGYIIGGTKVPAGA
jgi:hypothetical protein